MLWWPVPCLTCLLVARVAPLLITTCSQPTLQLHLRMSIRIGFRSCLCLLASAMCQLLALHSLLIACGSTLLMTGACRRPQHSREAFEGSEPSLCVCSLFSCATCLESLLAACLTPSLTPGPSCLTSLHHLLVACARVPLTPMCPKHVTFHCASCLLLVCPTCSCQEHADELTETRLTYDKLIAQKDED